MIKKETNVRGLDVGTAFIYSARKDGPKVSYQSVRNSFFDVERSDFAEDILRKNNMAHFTRKGRLYILGDDAIKFANLFGKRTRRPLKNGIISSREEESLSVVRLLIEGLLEKTRNKDIIHYSVPAPPIDADLSVNYHQDIVKKILENLGYQPKSLNEGLAVIYSGLKDTDYTGIGISIGGGMTNVCLTSMAIPILSFSIVRAGDWIDEEVAKATNNSVSRITTIKESGLNLDSAKFSSDKITQALYIYYGHLIDYILGKIKEEIEKHPGLRFEKPISTMIAGGSSIPEGFLTRFKEGVKKTELPLEIEGIKVASQPLLSVVEGTLKAGMVAVEHSIEHSAVKNYEKK